MGRYKYLFGLMLFIVGLALPGQISCQTITDPEAEYSRIRSTALAGNYTDAERDARRLVSQYPSYGDARILLGRIHAWQKDYENAAAIIDTLLMTEPGNEDALAALEDIKRWSAGEHAEKETFPTDIRMGYLFDTYSLPYNRFWQVVSAGAGNHFDWGTIMAGINIGNINLGAPANISKSELQFEAEAWPVISKKNYAYLAYAYSPGDYFPKNRAAVEVWQTLPAGWAVSAGVNYYYFSKDIFIADLSVEKYLGNFWLSAKGYFYFKDIGITTSFYLNSRAYFNKTDYLQMTLGTGTAPDEPFDLISDIERLSSNSIRLAYYNKITSHWAIRVGAGYSYEEYLDGEYRNRFEGGINLIYSFRMRK